MQKHSGQMQPRQFVPPLFVAACLAALLLLPLFPVMAYFLGIALSSYVIANILASMLSLRKIKYSLLPLVPIAFATLHLAYGLGFLTGIVRFWSYWGGHKNKSQSPASIDNLYGVVGNALAPDPREQLTLESQPGGIREKYPFVSVLMPIRNEAEFIGRSLGSVMGQDYPHDRMEILISDGMSTDATREVIEAIRRNNPSIELVLIENPGQAVSSGMNVGLARAKGEVIIRVDGHTLIDRNYVSECVAALERSGARNVGGLMSAVGYGLFGQAVAVATSAPFGVGGARFHYSNREEWVDTVYMGAWPRDVFRDIGPFDEEMVRNQDDEFNYRLRATGGKIFLTPRIKSQYYNRTTIGSLWRQYFQYGYWKVRVMQKHPGEMRLSHFIPPLFVTVLMMSFLMMPFFEGIRLIFGLVLTAYLVVNLGASFLEASRTPRESLILLPMVFAILHLSYGVGFLVGLAKFWNRWGSRRNRLERFEGQKHELGHV